MQYREGREADSSFVSGESSQGASSRLPECAVAIRNDCTTKRSATYRASARGKLSAINASELKLRLLIEGLSIDYDSLGVSDYKSDKYPHNDRHFAPKNRKWAVPQEILLSSEAGPRLCVGVLARPQSRFTLSCVDGVPRIALSGQQLDVQVSLLSEPRFWNRSTSDGVALHKLLSVPGLNELNLWPWHDCAYHYARQACAFCNTTATSVRAGTGRKSNLATAYQFAQEPGHGAKVANEIYPDLARRSREAVSIALQHDFSGKDYWFTIISGNVPDAMIPDQYQLFSKLLVDLIRDVPGLRRDQIVAYMMPPLVPAGLRALKDAGATRFMGSLEIWDPDLYSTICPGKANYGRKHFIDMLIQATEVFGRGNVWCNFVCGLEPFATQLEGYDQLGREGIVAGANVFHKDPLIRVTAVDEFTFENVRSYYLTAAELLHRHNLSPFYGLESRRSSLLWEAYLGYLG